MISLRKATLCLALFAIIGLWALPAAAAIGDTGTPYSGNGRASWAGTTEFGDSEVGGTVDWAVYGPGDFPFSGYSPTSGDFTYVYQVHCAGVASLSNFSVILQYAADNIGYFTAGAPGDVPNDQNIYPAPNGSASWDFDGIATGGSSCGLVFSSPNLPVDYYSIIVDHGEFQIAEPVPSPSSTSIPEPATLWLLGSGLGLVAVARRFRRA